MCPSSHAAWNYYPPVTEEQEAAAKNGKLPPRLHAHADMDVLTLLYQREGVSRLAMALKMLRCLQQEECILDGASEPAVSHPMGVT